MAAAKVNVNKNPSDPQASFDFSTALGPMRLTWSERGVSSLSLGTTAQASPANAPACVRDAAQRIAQHLAGEAVDLQTVPVDLEGLAPFHRRVYEALRRTRPGETLTYGHLASLAGSPGAAQAVGQALKHNPLPILVPCHRVLSASGLGGFSLLGGLDAKLHLLALEGAALRMDMP